MVQCCYSRILKSYLARHRDLKYWTWLEFDLFGKHKLDKALTYIQWILVSFSLIEIILKYVESLQIHLKWSDQTITSMSNLWDQPWGRFFSEQTEQKSFFNCDQSQESNHLPSNFDCGSPVQFSPANRPCSYHAWHPNFEPIQTK